MTTVLIDVAYNAPRVVAACYEICKHTAMTIASHGMRDIDWSPLAIVMAIQCSLQYWQWLPWYPSAQWHVYPVTWCADSWQTASWWHGVGWHASRFSVQFSPASQSPTRLISSQLNDTHSLIQILWFLKHTATDLPRETSHVAISWLPGPTLSVVILALFCRQGRPVKVFTSSLVAEKLVAGCFTLSRNVLSYQKSSKYMLQVHILFYRLLIKFSPCSYIDLE